MVLFPGGMAHDLVRTNGGKVKPSGNLNESMRTPINRSPCDRQPDLELAAMVQ